MNHWLIKSEQDCYSIDDLKKDKKTSWEGVRNYQARNFMKAMEVGDLVIFYHSSSDPTGAYGIAKIVGKAKPEEKEPTWFAPEVGFVEKFKKPISLQEIKFRPDLAGTPVAKRGNRLSVMPISEKHFEIIRKLGNS